jgi:hypothetical protein
MKNIKRMLGLAVVLCITVVMLTACDKFKEGEEYTVTEVYINGDKLTDENTAEGGDYETAADIFNIIGTQKIRFNDNGTINTWIRENAESDWILNDGDSEDNRWVRDGKNIKMYNGDGDEIEDIKINIAGKKLEIEITEGSEDEKTIKMVYERQ